jgi:hypothetical protein
MNFMKAINPDCLGAENFVDKDFKPIELDLTITNVTLEKPPAGGKEKACFYFDKTPKKAFLSNGEVKLLARKLRKADTDDWKGVVLTISCAEKKFAGKPVMGMIITKINGKEVR